VKVETEVALGANASYEDLKVQFDAIYLAFGLATSPSLGIPGEEHILDGLTFIEQSKMDPQGLKVGGNVVVIGAGNTAVDCATVAKRLGASRVTMVYRRTDQEMTAYPHEYDFVRKEGVEFRFLTQPIGVRVESGNVTGLECVCMELTGADHTGRPAPRPKSGSEFFIEADQVVKSIGQDKSSLAKLLDLATERGYIKVNGDYETSLPGVFAGGDCIRAKGAASTVMAVQDGKLTARAINKKLLGGN
jgi:glutamate synthase (NADPH/NADH) small chain